MTALALLLSFAVAQHEAHIEHVGTFLKAAPTSTNHIPGHATDDQRMQHAHTNYIPLGQALTNTFNYQSPSIAPRRESHHKQLLQILESGSRHAFDNTNLPVLD